jgi:hypothetical protein
MTRRSRREVREDDLVLISFLYERSCDAKSGISYDDARTNIPLGHRKFERGLAELPGN